ncbi:PepSY domain-containing protein [Nocardia sp. NBC_00508]|uniref:PepSY domain-containing protein n=1 Tax=Nocardia sp. NBC_00508 TaxID=2975992 RepID=UPI002E81CB19|nr:PepSY domain-containing protein [Nocardia sp. NBC_00508]WUD65198.1 PepSY domain-containing protein [Nocardia sp. NBC_00508]
MTTAFRRAYAGLRWVIFGAAVAAVVAGVSFALGAVATGGHDHTIAFNPSARDWSLVADPGINRQQAIDKAIEAVPGGRVDSAELDTDRGTPVWEVELTTPDGVEHEVTIDANSGQVLAKINHD